MIFVWTLGRINIHNHNGLSVAKACLLYWFLCWTHHSSAMCCYLTVQVSKVLHSSIGFQSYSLDCWWWKSSSEFFFFLVHHGQCWHSQKEGCRHSRSSACGSYFTSTRSIKRKNMYATSSNLRWAHMNLFSLCLLSRGINGCGLVMWCGNSLCNIIQQGTVEGRCMWGQQRRSWLDNVIEMDHRMDRMMTMQQLMEDLTHLVSSSWRPPHDFSSHVIEGERSLISQSSSPSFFTELLNTRIIEYSECTLLAQNVKVDMCHFTKWFSVQCHVYMHGVFFFRGGGD